MNSPGIPAQWASMQTRIDYLIEADAAMHRRFRAMQWHTGGMKPMAEPEKALPGTFMYRDCRTWPEGERWELIDGVAWNMSPAPLPTHQRISGRLARQLDRFLDGKPCELFQVPVDILFPVSANPTTRRTQ